MLNKVRLARQLWRYLGPTWLLFRLQYAVKLRTGLLRRKMPAYQWNDRPLSTWLKPTVPTSPIDYKRWRQQHGGHFFFDHLPAIPQKLSGELDDAIEEANQILSGRWRYFQRVVYEIGFPPDWHLNPMTGQRVVADRHWTQISDFVEGDIKLVWEANRFGAIYPLVRAYASTRDERYAEAFWLLIENWAVENPPNMGPNWKCGQEISLRLMAWIFGLYAFWEASCTTPERIAALVALIAAQADRVDRNTDYAYSAKSNHGISEAVGLWTVGLLFPELASAPRWRNKGRKLLCRETNRQIYADGTYVMPSFNYFRMVLHACIWALRLGELNDQPFEQSTYDALAKGISFFSSMIDPFTGQTPNFGSNDGALILPLNSCDYLDYRPLLQLGWYACSGQFLLSSGPWDEDVFWLYGPEALSALRKGSCAKTHSFDSGGYYILRSDVSWSMIRCAQLHDRPFQADQLHVDLWWKGMNIACDAGTYLYNGPKPWSNGLAATSVHNSVTIDNLEQMSHAGRFTWIDWAQGRKDRFLDGEFIQYWEGEHDGYLRLSDPVIHERSVIRIGFEHWVVIDRLRGNRLHDYRLHWLIPDYPYTWSEEKGKLTIVTPAGQFLVMIGSPNVPLCTSLVRADNISPRGWRSRYYSQKDPAISLAGTVKCSDGDFVTFFGPSGHLILLESAVHIENDTWTARIVLDSTKSIQSISVEGAWTENLRL